MPGLGPGLCRRREGDGGPEVHGDPRAVADARREAPLKGRRHRCLVCVRVNSLEKPDTFDAPTRTDYEFENDLSGLAANGPWLDLLQEGWHCGGLADDASDAGCLPEFLFCPTAGRGCEYDGAGQECEGLHDDVRCL